MTAVATTTIHRAENVGSLLRPDWLKTARDELMAGQTSIPEFKRIEDRAVDEALALLERVGIDVLTDGEQRRGFFFSTLTDVVEGLGLATETPPAPMEWHGSSKYRSSDATFSLPVVITGRLRRLRSLATEEFVYGRARTDRPLKVTLPSPLCLVALWDAKHSRDAYPEPIDLVADATEILRDEIRELVAVGCTNIQIDAPEIGTLVDPEMREWYQNAVKVDPDQMLTEGIELVNEVAKAAEDVRFGIHICRGNNAGRFLASGGYDAISPQVFPRLNAFDYFMLEYDDERSGGFEPLRDLPDDKTVVVGLVSTKLPTLERPDVLRARLDEAAGYYPLDQLALSTQCGFASTSEGNPLTGEEQEAKLRLVADLAHDVWK